MVVFLDWMKMLRDSWELNWVQMRVGKLVSDLLSLLSVDMQAGDYPERRRGRMSTKYF